MTDFVELSRAALRGRCSIERKLGEGGMAVVFLAKDERHDRSVALKCSGRTRFSPERHAALRSSRQPSAVGLQLASPTHRPPIAAAHNRWTWLSATDADR